MKNNLFIKMNYFQYLPIDKKIFIYKLDDDFLEYKIKLLSLLGKFYDTVYDTRKYEKDQFIVAKFKAIRNVEFLPYDKFLFYSNDDLESEDLIKRENVNLQNQYYIAILEKDYNFYRNISLNYNIITIQHSDNYWNKYPVNFTPREKLINYFSEYNKSRNFIFEIIEPLMKIKLTRQKGKNINFGDILSISRTLYGVDENDNPVSFIYVKFNIISFINDILILELE
jgi:hypothetical protein